MPHWPVYLGPNIDASKSLERVIEILYLLGNPNLKLKNVIHITGTNGKGSVANYIYNILRKHKLSVGLYTSPHIYYSNERIITNDKEIDDNSFRYHIDRVRFVCEKENIVPSIFEATTIAAIDYFSSQNLDFNVIEVGMGGRNDATNVFGDNKIASVFTPIDVDHVKFLGNTPIENAIEKSFIIRANKNVIIGKQQFDVQQFLCNVAKNLNCNIVSDEVDYITEFLNDGKFNIKIDNKIEKYEPPKLLGKHQIENASLAIATIATILPNYQKNYIQDGILATKWRVRLEIVDRKNSLYQYFGKNSEIIIDGAHNIHGARALNKFIADKISENNMIENVLVISRTAGADNYSFAKEFIKNVKYIIATQGQMESFPESAEKIQQETIKSGIECDKSESLDGAMNLISKKYSNNIRVIICGSLYLAREVKFY